LPVFRLAVLVLPALLLAQSTHKAGSRRLLVISVAGLDERFLTAPATRVKVPNIRKLMRQGTTVSGVVGVAPSDTWSSGISLVTGVTPAEEGAPLWRAASKIGLKTAAVFWPGTAGAEIGFDFPATRESQQGRDIQFDDVARKASPPGIADRIEKASPGFQKQVWDDKSAAQAAAYLLRVEKPDLLLVQFTDVESEQRETTALGAYARDALENDDELIGQILAAMLPDSVVALVSGHGLENEDYIVRPRVLLKAPVEVADGLIGATDRAVADRLRKLMNDGHRHGLAREVPMAEVRAKAPSILNWVAAFDTPPNYVASAQDRGAALGPGTHLGVSGFWPTRPGYRSVLVISGQGVPARRLGEIDLLQIAPTLADVIGVALPQAKQKSLWPSIAH
jgi:hypothetical protein